MQILKLYILLFCATLISGNVLAELMSLEPQDTQTAELAGTKAEAAQMAQKKIDGRVLKVEQRGDKYKVKMLQNSGRVVSVIINKKPKQKPKPDPRKKIEEK